MTTLPAWLLRAKQLREATTPGPWDWSDYGIYSTTQIDGPPGLQAPRQICSEVFLSDVEFIASAPETQRLMEHALEIALDALEYTSITTKFNIGYTEAEHLSELANERFFDRDRALKAIAEIEKLGEK